MKFNSEAERQEHKTVSLIPKQIWKQSFRGEMPDDVLEVMEVISSDLMEQLSKFPSLEALSRNEKEMLFYAVSYGHDDLSDDVLLSCLEMIEPHPGYMLKLALSIENELLGEKIIEKYHKKIGEILRVGDKYDRNYAVFRQAAEKGYLGMLQKLMDASSKRDKEKMIKAPAYEDNYAAFRAAAKKGHTDVMQYLLEALENIAPRYVKEMLFSGDWSNRFSAFQCVASAGDLRSMQFLMGLLPEEDKRLTVQCYEASFTSAAEAGKKNIMQFLLDNFKVLQFEKAEEQACLDYMYHRAFIGAAQYGQVEILDYLILLAPNDVEAMIKEENYRAFMKALDNLHLGAIEKIIEKQGEIDSQALEEMVLARGEGASIYASAMRRLDIVSCLLEFPSLFAHAEQHENEYDNEAIKVFIAEQLALLREAKSDFGRSNPGVEFDISDNRQSRLCFYMLRNLIRKNDEALLDDIAFLINIPSAKTLLTEPLC